MCQSKLPDVWKIMRFGLWMGLLTVQLLFSCISLNRLPNKTPNVGESLKIIPEEHRERIESLFRNLIIRSAGAYTLFGAKPMSMEAYIEAPEFLNSYDLYHPQINLAMKLGWQSWQTYQKMFKSNSYRLKRISYDDMPGCFHIYIINQAATLNVITKHILVFNSTLGTDLSPQDLWEKIDSSDAFFAQVVQHADLLGILLGFGKENAEAFDRRTQICLRLAQHYIPPFRMTAEINKLSPKAYRLVRGYSLQALRKLGDLPGLSSNTSCLASELNCLCDRMEFFNLEGNDQVVERFTSPMFAQLDANAETEQCRKAYEETRKKLDEKLNGKPFLKTVLEQWTAGAI